MKQGYGVGTGVSVGKGVFVGTSVVATGTEVYVAVSAPTVEVIVEAEPVAVAPAAPEDLITTVSTSPNT